MLNIAFWKKQPCRGFARWTLTARIVLAMLCMVTLVAVSYGLAIIYGIGMAEETLMGREMQAKLELAVSGQHPSYYREAERIYTDAPGQAYPIPPERYRDLPEGFSESLGDPDYFVLKIVRDGRTWLIVQDQYGFEDEEVELYVQAIIGFFIVLLLSVVVGLWLARAVTRPVRMLAREVRQMAQETSFRPLEHRPMQDEIGELALTVETTLKKFNEALARERAFTADVSHELRTPLMVISSTAEVLRLPATPEEREKRLQRIEAACRRLNRLILVFLELARGGHESLGEQVPWIRVVQEAVDNWRTEANKKGLTIAWVSAATREVKVKSAFAESVVDNLLRNALQYTDEGGVVVRLSDAALSVEDTGCGIAVGDKEKILQAFVRGRSAPGEGYGWGLSLVRRICQHEGWSLTFTANHPHGTVFTITFNENTRGNSDDAR